MPIAGGGVNRNAADARECGTCGVGANAELLLPATPGFGRHFHLKGLVVVITVTATIACYSFSPLRQDHSSVRRPTALHVRVPGEPKHRSGQDEAIPCERNERVPA